MRCPTRTRTAHARHDRGFTLVELLVALAIFSVVMLVISSFMRSSNRVHAQTVRQAELQTDVRQTLDMISAEVRQAGADPSTPAIGIVPIAYADSVSIRTRSDLNSSGTIQAADQSTGPSEDVTYTYNPGAKTITRNPGTGAAVVLANVTAMRLTYFDATNQPLAPVPLSTANAALVHSIDLTITAADRDSLPTTVATRIMLRNQ